MMATNPQTDTGHSVLTSKDTLSPPEHRGPPTVERTSTHASDETQRQRNAATRQLLHGWLADESGYDEETWPRLKQALEDNRSGSRRLFHD